ncbi:MAG: metallophosphoesterase [Terriglobia bacterium]|jgi:Icc-related predicted phosphoesterase
MARLVYTSDVHGDLELYRAAGEAALTAKADALIFGGDLCPGTPSPRHIDLPQSQPAFLLEQLAPLVEEWKSKLPTMAACVIPGNDDCGTILAALEEMENRKLLVNLHQKKVALDDFELIGLAFVPPTPFSFKDFERRDTPQSRRPEPQLARPVLATAEGFKTLEDFDAYLDAQPTIEEELSRLNPERPGKTVAVMHSPPFETRCDVLFNGEHIGSRAIRRWIERHQPLLTLHGHIHESPKQSGSFFDRIGSTVVINPGASGRRPHWVLLDLENIAALEHSVYGRAIA